jgi:chromosome segregation ATPase
MTGANTKMRTVRRVARSAAALLASLLVAGTVWAAGLYKWTDDKGEVHYSDKAPQETPTKGATVLDKQGRHVKKIEPPLTPEQIKAKADEDEQQRALAKARDDQARKDKALMQSYTSESEIQLARNRALTTIDTQIKSAQAFSADLMRRQKELAKRKESYGSKPIPIELQRESEGIDTELSRQAVLIRQKQEEQTMVTAKYDTITQRWREILADQERTRAAAAEAEAAKTQNPPPPGGPGKAASARPPAGAANK